LQLKVKKPTQSPLPNAKTPNLRHQNYLWSILRSLQNLNLQTVGWSRLRSATPASITVSRPAWQTVGDQVDVPFGDELWHGVVLSGGSRESVHVYWVGVPPMSATRRQALKREGNPVKILRESLIWHQPGAMEGNRSLHSVELIKENYIRWKR
jgi:hypothetical protein